MSDFLTRADYDAAANTILRHTQQRPTIGLVLGSGLSSLADSLAAGNCQAGSEQFARRHGLNPTRWYKPNELLAVANGDAQRVRLAVLAAVRRHDRLAEAGAQVIYPNA